MYSRMPYGQDWVEGDVYPVVAFHPDEFFVPEQFLPDICGDEGTAYKLTDINQDCRVNLLDLEIFVQEWLSCTDPSNAACNQ